MLSARPNEMLAIVSVSSQMWQTENLFGFSSLALSRKNKEIPLSERRAMLLNHVAEDPAKD
jgi:hypothetical protein